MINNFYLEEDFTTIGVKATRGKRIIKYSGANGEDLQLEDVEDAFGDLYSVIICKDILDD